MQDYNQAFLAQLQSAADGIDLSAEEQKTLKWIAGWDNFTVNNVASIIEKAKRYKGVIQS